MSSQSTRASHSPPPLRIQTQSRPRRLSKFTEGSELTRPELLNRTPTSNELFFTILSEMDRHEAAKRMPHSHSPSSTTSSPLSPQRHSNQRNNRHSESSTDSFEDELNFMGKDQERALFEHGVREGRRSVTWGRKSMDERPQMKDIGGEVGVKIKEFKGRLRALTVGRGS